MSLEDRRYKAEQLSIFLENRAGRLAEVIHLLAEHGVNLRAISLADTSDFGILRLMISNVPYAEDLLKKRGFTTGKTAVVAVEMPDKEGSLDHILQLMSANRINVEYMYSYARRNLEKAIMIFRFDKIDAAISILRQNQITLLAFEEFSSL